MNKKTRIDLIASLCLLVGSIMNLIDVFVDFPFILWVGKTVLILLAAFLYLVAIPRIKK